MREFTYSDSSDAGMRAAIPSTRLQPLFMDMEGEQANWRGTIPAGTQLSNNEGSEDTLTYCEVGEVFSVTDTSILPGLDTGGNNPISPGPYQPIITTNWVFAIPRGRRVSWHLVGPMEITPAPLATSPAQTTWVRFTDIATSIGGGFSSETDRTVLQANRVRTFSVDALVSANWHEGDYIRSEGQYYVIQSRRVIYDQREIEFDAEANPSFRIVAPPEELV